MVGPCPASALAEPFHGFNIAPRLGLVRFFASRGAPAPAPVWGFLESPDNHRLSAVAPVTVGFLVVSRRFGHDEWKFLTCRCGASDFEC